MKRMLTVILFAFFTTHCSSSQYAKPEFIPLDTLTIIAQIGENITTCQEHYLVSHFKDIAQVESLIDSFAMRLARQRAGGYAEYILYFYKETKMTNLERIKENRRTIDRYSMGHDLLYVYTWNGGKLFNRSKVRDGKWKDDPVIKVEDLP